MALPSFANFIPGFRPVDNSILNQLFTAQRTFTAAITGGSLDGATVGATTPAAGSFTTLQTNGLQTTVPQLLTAAGATQGNAAAITKSLAIITVSTTASTHGVRLPTASTGLQIQVGNAGSFGVKVYPATNGKIAAASTNAADSTVLAVNKTNTYTAVNKTFWIVDRGA